MNTSSIHVHPYTLRMPPDAPRTIDQIMADLASVEKMPEYEFYEDSIRMERCERSEDGSYWRGYMTRLRRKNLPLGTDGGPVSQELTIPDGGALSEPAAFLCVPSKKLLLLERNFRAVSEKAWTTYLDQFEKYPFPIDPLPIFRSDAEERLRKLKTERRIRVKLAGLRSLPSELKQSETIKSAGRISAVQDAETIELVISTRFKGTTLRESDLTIKDCYAIQESAPDALLAFIVAGENPETGKLDEINLLKTRIRSTQTVQYKGHTIPVDFRIKAVERAWLGELSGLL